MSDISGGSGISMGTSDDWAGSMILGGGDMNIQAGDDERVVKMG